MTIRRVNLWLLLAFAALLVLVLDTGSTTGTPAIEPAVGVGGVFSRLRRVQKSTPSTVAPLKDTRQTKSTGRLLKSRSTTSAALMTLNSTGKSPKPTESIESLRQRLDETVQKVRARSKEFKMEQEQKRVDRKLRRDQKKLDREQPSAPVAPVNPHNLKMPDCPAGKVYNGRRCVLAGKMPKH